MAGIRLAEPCSGELLQATFAPLDLELSIHGSPCSRRESYPAARRVIPSRMNPAKGFDTLQTVRKRALYCYFVTS